MNYLNIKGEKLSLLGMGTWGMGGNFYKDSSNDAKDLEALEYGLSKGINHIDTAEIYAQGHAEELVGQAIKNLNREDIFITTKVHQTNLKKNDVLNAIKGSLKRLKTDYVDLYLIHWPNPEINLDETISALDQLVSEGFTRYIGVSNFDIELLQQAEKYSQNQIFANQVHFNLFNLEAERKILPFCQNHNIVLTAYSPLAKGTLTNPQIDLLESLSKKYQKTIPQIALNFLLSHKNVITIPKSSNKSHIDENLGSLNWNLSHEDFDLIHQEFTSIV